MALASIIKATEVLRIFRLSKILFNILTEKSVHNAIVTVPFNIPHINYYSTDETPKARGRLSNPFPPEAPKKHKPLTSPQIMLISPDNKVVLTNLEDAEKLAKRRDLKLLKILDFDTKSEKPLYRLYTKKEYLADSSSAKVNKKNSLLKALKLFSVSTKISEHDLVSKVSQMMKLLKKNHIVRIVISKEGNSTRADEMVKVIQEDLAQVSTLKITVGKATKTLTFSPKLEKETINENVSKDEKNEKVSNDEKNEKVNNKENQIN